MRAWWIKYTVESREAQGYVRTAKRITSAHEIAHVLIHREGFICGWPDQSAADQPNNLAEGHPPL